MALIKLVENDTLDTSIKAIYRQIERAFGEVTPNFKLAAVSPGVLKDLLGRGAYLVLESGIRPVLFAVVRYIVASKEKGEFCISFNSNILQQQGFSDADLKSLIENVWNDNNFWPF